MCRLRKQIGLYEAFVPCLDCNYVAEPSSNENPNFSFHILHAHKYINYELYSESLHIKT